MANKIGWGITGLLSFVCFISFIFWFLADSRAGKWIFLITFALQIYGIFTKENKKNS